MFCGCLLSCGWWCDVAMNPLRHPRGAPPDFSMAGLPPNPRPKRLTNAMWWLICMHKRLVPSSKHGGDYVNKPGGHNAGEHLPDYGEGDPRTDHSIRRRPDRTGPWWRQFCAAEDWTFPNDDEMQLYARRLYNSLKDPNDTRGDDVFQYFIGDIDGDPHVEGWHEYNDDDVSGDSTHMWHQHRQYRRNIVGSYEHMWKALTIDMGWTPQEWRRSVAPQQEDDVTEDQIIAAVNKALASGAGQTAIGTGTWNHMEIDPRSGQRDYRMGGGARMEGLRRDEQTAKIVAAITAAARGDDEALAAIQNQLARLPDLVLAELADETRTDDEIAAALRAVLGDRAPAVGALLAS